MVNLLLQHTLYESGDNFGWIEIEKITKDIYDISLELYCQTGKDLLYRIRRKTKIYY